MNLAKCFINDEQGEFSKIQERVVLSKPYGFKLMLINCFL